MPPIKTLVFTALLSTLAAGQSLTVCKDPNYQGACLDIGPITNNGVCLGINDDYRESISSIKPINGLENYDCYMYTEPNCQGMAEYIAHDGFADLGPKGWDNFVRAYKCGGSKPDSLHPTLTNYKTPFANCHHNPFEFGDVSVEYFIVGRDFDEAKLDNGNGFYNAIRGCGALFNKWMWHRVSDWPTTPNNQFWYDQNVAAQQAGMDWWAFFRVAVGYEKCVGDAVVKAGGITPVGNCN